MKNNPRRRIKSYEPLPSYILAVVISIEIMLILLELGSFQDFNIDDLRYFLSALSQIEGTIMAIYVTITLVAIQLTPKEYFEVVFENFRSKREFWAVIISYTASIIFAILVLQNVSFIVGRNLSWPLLTICTVWGIFNLVILPLFLWDLFLMLNHKRSIIANLIKNITNSRKRTELFEIAYNAIQIPMVQTTTYILSEVWKYIMLNFSEKLKNISKMLIEGHLKDTENVKEEFNDMLRFTEDITYNLRAIALKTIDETRSGKITTNDAIWVLDIISFIFGALLSSLVISLSPYHVPDVEESLKHTLSQCISELESVMKELKRAPSEIKKVELWRFADSMPYDLVNKLEKVGWGDIAKQVRRLETMGKEDRYKDFVDVAKL